MEIDLKNISSVEQLHLELKDRLQLPGFYGMNWDAFWDAITGLVTMPQQLSLLGWNDFSRKFPKDSKTLLRIVRDYNSVSEQQIVLVN